MAYTLKNIIKIKVVHQDTRSCVMRPSLGAQDTVRYLLEPTFKRFQPFITQKLLGQFYQNHSLDALQFR